MKNEDDIFGPRKVTLKELGINSLGALISGIIGSLLILVVMFFIAKGVNLKNTMNTAGTALASSATALFPFILSFITFIASSITIFATYFFLSSTDSEKYKKNHIIYGQLAVLSTMIYIFITPVYIYLGLESYNNIIYIFIIHMMILIFSFSMLIEVLNSYRYVLIGLYGSIISLFITMFLSYGIFSFFGTGFAKLISLLILLPFINASMVFFKQKFEFIYYHYFKTTGLDQLGDIFYQIENEEKEALKIAEEMNNL